MVKYDCLNFMAPQPSGKARVCKTLMPQFESERCLQYSISNLDKLCWCGGIGRRTGLKILRCNNRTSSSLVTSTKRAFCSFFVPRLLFSIYAKCVPCTPTGTPYLHIECLFYFILSFNSSLDNLIVFPEYNLHHVWSPAPKELFERNKK